MISGEIRKAPDPRAGLRNARLWLAGIAVVTLTGCSTLYFHDDLGASKASEANKQLTDAPSLKPFDDQSANLAAFASQEDKAVAHYWTVARDAEFADVLAAKDQVAVLKRLVDDRLSNLAPAALIDPAALANLAELPESLSRLSDYQNTFEENAEANLVNYRLLKPDDKRGCKEIENLNDAGVRALRGAGTTAERALERAAKSCVEARKYRNEFAVGRAQITSFGGLLADEFAKANDKRAEATGELSARSQALDAKIKEAEEWAKAGDAAKLETFRKDLTTLLQGPSEAIKAAGWADAEKQIDAILRTLVCVAPKGGTTDEEIAAANCDAIDKGSTTDRAVANFKLVQALLALADVQSSKAKQAQWLLAARAIIAGERTDAALKLDLAQTAAKLSGQRYEYLLNEAATLAGIKRLFQGHHGSSCRGTPFSCGFAAYVGSWNDARIPAEIFPYHALQSERLYAVRRSRTISEKQRALALAGTGALDSRYAGGVQPSLVAQLVFDAGIFGAQVAK